MDILPLETVTNVCSNLDHQSLANFSLCDKRTREASKTFLFQHVCIKASAGRALAILCERWSSFLQEVKSAQHVRTLEILASLQPKNPPPRRDAGPRSKRYEIMLHRTDGMLADKHCDPEFRNVLAPVEIQAVVVLVKLLRGLRHMTWDCPWQPIPPPVLETLEKMDCRLSLPSFRLHSLLRRPMQDVEIDDSDLQLATSPCLESVTLRYEAKEEEFENYNYDALLEMIAGAAPNLRYVTLEDGARYLATQGHGITDPNFQHPRGPRKAWRSDIFPKMEPPSSKALKCLRLRRWMSTNDLIVLSNKTDFSLLRSLHMGTDAGAEELSWLTGRLSSLQTLDINLEARYRPVQELHFATKTFFLSLPPLKYLTLKGTWTSDTIESILGRHGATLLRLLCPLTPFCTSPIGVELVQACCPGLEELSIPIQRTQGDFQEVSIYRALGQLPARTVTLFLRQTVPNQTREHFSEDKIPDLLVNCAVDEELARSIFVEIASRREHLGLPSLETLNLHPENINTSSFGSRYCHALMLPIAHLYRSWSCVRNPRDDCGATICVVRQETPPNSRSQRASRLMGLDPVGALIERGLNYDTLDPRVERILRSVWPESGSWQDICHSLPLASQTEQT